MRDKKQVRKKVSNEANCKNARKYEARRLASKCQDC